MKTAALLALAAAIAAGVATVAAPAEANGVRLQFGGPLGSFVARPTEGYARSPAPRSYAAPSHHAFKSEKTKPGAVAAWTAPKKPAGAKSRSRDETDDDARPSKQKVAAAARRARSADQKDGDDAPSASSSVKQIATNSVPIVSSVAPSEPKPASLSGTGPLAAPTAGTLKLDAKGVPADEPKAASVDTAAIETATLAPADATHHAAPEDTKPDAKLAGAKTEKRSEKKGDCRRFIPFVGVTISVRCGD